MIRKFMLLVSMLASCAARAEVVDRILAVVNDDIVTQSDVTALQKKLKTKSLVDEALLGLYDEKKLIADAKAAEEFLIDERLIDSEIRKQGIVSPIEQVEAEIRNIAKANNSDRNQMKAALKNKGINYSDYQDFVKTSLQRQTLLQKEVSSKIKISDEEVTSYYVSHYASSKALVYEYTLAHILFLSSNGGLEQAEKRAGAVRAKLDQKVPFESLAAQYSEDPNFVQGGYFGTFKVSDFNKDVESAISHLNVNDVSQIVKMADGYRIFKVTKKTLVPSPDYESRKDQIRGKLMSESYQRQFAFWLKEKRRESYVRVN